MISLIHNSLKCFMVAIKCQPKYPYAFMWGLYCCTSKLEKNSSIGMDECNGGAISLNSICCKDNDYEKCPDDRGCSNHWGEIILNHET